MIQSTFACMVVFYSLYGSIVKWVTKEKLQPLYTSGYFAFALLVTDFMSCH